jgi:hypothetical protein
VSNVGITQVLHSCLQLKFLCLQGCKSITEDVSPEFGRACFLEFLDLSWVDGMPEKAAVEIIKARTQNDLARPFEVLDYYTESHKQ